MAQLLLDVLQKTISQNQEDQKRALEFLNDASTRDFPAFVKELSVILRSENCQPFARQAAGLQLKNVLYAKEEETRAQYLNRWLALPADIRTHVKLLVVQTLGTEPFRPSIAAQCVAAIACAELPSGLWPDVIDALRTSVTNPGSTASLKESSLETLGYICQDIDAAVLEQQSNSILTAIVHGMRKEEPSFHVRLAATNALLNSLEFTKKNFGMEAERHIIMQVVCEATQCTDTHVKVAALQCLVRIMSLYYQFMEQYMGSGPVRYENDDDDDWTPSKAAGFDYLIGQCNQLMDLQSLLCATLQSVLRKMRPEDAALVGEHVMNGLVQIMNRTSNNKGGGSVMEEALLAVSVLAETLNNGFIAYIDALKPHLMRALANHEEPQVCAAAVGLVTDISRAIEVNIAPALDDIMNTLVQSLQSPRLDKDVKVTILGCFGDIALAIGIHFERYIQIVMAMLAEASSAAIVTNPQDYDQVDYVDKLRENCIMAYTGILQGMRPVGSDTDPEKKNQAKVSLSRFVPAMVKMIAICCETVPVSPSDGLVASVAGLIGDLVVLYGTQITPELSNDKVRWCLIENSSFSLRLGERFGIVRRERFASYLTRFIFLYRVKALLDRGRKSRTSKTKSVAIWARKEMQKAMNAVTPAP
ncbi:Importin-beta protein [Ostertagia ostertagi]